MAVARISEERDDLRDTEGGHGVDRDGGEEGVRIVSQ